METLKIGKSLPFKTQDAILAFCLYSAGVPEALPPSNIYDPETLNKLGYRGYSLEDGAKAAFKKNQRGTVEYYFEKTPELDYFLKSYADQQAKVNASGANTDAGVAMREIMSRVADSEKPMDEREGLLRVGCVLLKLRSKFVRRPLDNPWIRIPSESDPNGFKLIPLNASDELKQKMNL